MWVHPKAMQLNFGKRTSDHINKAIAEFVSNIPFQVVEHAAFSKLVHSLNPQVKPPSRRALAGGLLDEAFAEHRKHLKTTFTGQLATLSMDAWSTADNCSVLGMGLNNELVMVMQDNDRHTASNLADIACQYVPCLIVTSPFFTVTCGAIPTWNWNYKHQLLPSSRTVRRTWKTCELW